MSGRAGVACAMIAVSALASCGPKKQKVELIYEEPVTKAWTASEPAPAPPPQEMTPPAPLHPPGVAPQGMPPSTTQGAYGQPGQPPAQTYPPAGSYPPGSYPPAGSNPSQAPPSGSPPAQAMPPGYAPPATAYPQQQYPPSGQAQPRQPPGAWRSAQPVQPPPTGFPDASVTTTVVPDPNPTTQTTLKRRTGWVRGGYD